MPFTAEQRKATVAVVRRVRSSDRAITLTPGQRKYITSHPRPIGVEPMRDDVLHALFELSGIVFFVLACIHLAQIIW